jgi:hypothetical protein
MSHLLISDLLPSINNVDGVFVREQICISSVNVAVGWDVEQGSVSESPGAFFDLIGKGVAVARGQIEARLGTEVLFCSFI